LRDIDCFRRGKIHTYIGIVWRWKEITKDGVPLQLPSASSANKHSLVRRSSLCESDEPQTRCPCQEWLVTGLELKLNCSDRLSRDAFNHFLARCHVRCFPTRNIDQIIWSYR